MIRVFYIVLFPIGFVHNWNFSYFIHLPEMLFIPPVFLFLPHLERALHLSIPAQPSLLVREVGYGRWIADGLLHDHGNCCSAHHKCPINQMVNSLNCNSVHFFLLLLVLPNKPHLVLFATFLQIHLRVGDILDATIPNVDNMCATCVETIKVICWDFLT